MPTDPQDVLLENFSTVQDIQGPAACPDCGSLQVTSEWSYSDDPWFGFTEYIDYRCQRCHAEAHFSDVALSRELYLNAGFWGLNERPDPNGRTLFPFVRFRRLIARIGRLPAAAPDPDWMREFERVESALRSAWSESQRFYHTLDHLSETLIAFSKIRGLATNPDSIELALFFHDFVYDSGPRAHSKSDTNESASAARFEKLMTPLKILDDATLRSVRELILMTEHHRAHTPDEKIMSDADLSILGATPERFREYQEQIRQEYSWVPEETYRSRRAEIMKSFRERNPVFHFLVELEPAARRNLSLHFP